MDLKKEFFHRKIKQETENESDNNNISETFTTTSTTNNILQIKFEDTTTFTDDINEPEDEIERTLKAIINGDRPEEPNQLKECKTIPLPKNNLDVELISNKQICRLCAQPITTSTEIFLYEDGGDLEQKINYSLPITTSLGDGLPEYICQNCETNLNMFYEFVSQVVNADKTIRQRINPPPDDIKTNAIIKQIFGTEEELEEETNDHHHQLLEEETGEDCLRQETNEMRLSEEDLITDIKTTIIKVNEKKPNKHLIHDDDNFKPNKIQKICVLDPVIQEKSNEQYICHICNENFSDCFTLAAHNSRTHPKIQYSCPESDCNQMFTTQKSLRQHITDNHNVPVICYKCGKIFAHQPALDKHRENAHSKRVCETCGADFNSVGSYVKHISLHTEVSVFQCVYCFKNFANRHKLHRHTRQVHTGKYTLLVHKNEDEV